MASALSGQIDHHHDHTTTTGIPNKKLFMWAFLASDCMFFGSLISTHLIYRLHPPAGTEDLPRKLFSVELTSFSTFILLMSSLLMALAVNACQKGSIRSTRANLLGTIFFGLIFLGCQVYEFTHFVHLGLTLSSSMFGSTFYVLTGTHGCHVAIGVLWLTLIYIRTFKPEGDVGAGTAWLLRVAGHLGLFALAAVFGIWATLDLVHAGLEHGFTAQHLLGAVSHHPLHFVITLLSVAALAVIHRSNRVVEFGEANAIDVEGCGLYWHFVDIVWIVIFTAVYLYEYL